MYCNNHDDSIGDDELDMCRVPLDVFFLFLFLFCLASSFSLISILQMTKQMSVFGLNCICVPFSMFPFL